jgi:hypothetical protein
MQELFNDEQRRLDAKQAFLDDLRQNHAATIKTAQLLLQDITDTSHWTIDFGNSVDVRWAGTFEDYQTFYKAFRKLGLVPNSRILDEGEPVESFSTYWSLPGTSLKIWVAWTSTVCKRVQVGTRTVQQPVYEVRCS